MAVYQKDVYFFVMQFHWLLAVIHLSVAKNIWDNG